MTTVAIFYGVNYFTLKSVFEEGHSNFAVLALRCIFATTFFILFHTFAIKEKIKSGRDYLMLALCALFGVSLNQTLFLWGLKETSSVNAAVLMITTPIFVFLVAWLLKEEKITPRKLLGLFISFVGAAMLIVSGSDESMKISGASISGDLMIIGNAASYGIYLVIVRPLVLKYNTFTIVKWLFIFGSIPNIAIGMPDLMVMEFSKMSTEAWIGVAWLLAFATVGAYFLNAWSMKKVPSSAVGVYIYFQPVFVTLFSVILSKGDIDWIKLQFILLIFAGVYLVTSTGKIGRRRQKRRSIM